MKELMKLCSSSTASCMQKSAARNTCGDCSLMSVQDYAKEDSAAVNVHDNTELSALHYAVLNGNIKVIQILIDSGANVNDLSVASQSDVKTQGLASLHLAARTGNEDVFNTLLMNGADIHLADSDGQRALHHACEARHIRTVELILNNGGNIDVIDNSGYTPLCSALRNHECFSTDIKLVKKLIDRNADVNLVGEMADYTPLHLASESQESDLIELLCEKGAYLSVTKHGTPLHIAAAKGSGKTVVALLARKADPNQRDNKGETALHKASFRSDEQVACVIKSLLKHGANPALYNDDQKIPLDIAIDNGHNTAIETLLKFTTTTTVNARSFKALLEKHPEYVEELFTNSIAASYESEESSESEYDLFGFDFCLLNMNVNEENQATTSNNNTIKAVAQSKELCLINHPLFQIFMRYKWNTTRYAFYMNLLTYLMFLVLLTSVLLSSRIYVVASLSEQEGQNSSTKVGKPLADELYDAVWWRILCLVLMILNACHLSKEFMEILTLRFEYFQSIENYLDCAIHTLTINLLLGLMQRHITETQWAAGDIALLLAWIKLMYFLRYFDIFNAYLYVLMFFKVTQIFCSFMLIFIIPTLAFSLSFHCILWKTPAFDNPIDSFFKTIAMTTGEITFDEIITINERQSIVSKLIMAIFQVLSPILLMNLLIGLAVGDIDDLRSKAQVKRCQNEVNVITDIEKEISLQERIVLLFKYLVTCQLRKMKMLLKQRNLNEIRHCSEAHNIIDKVLHNILRFLLRLQVVFARRNVPPHKNKYRKSAAQFSVRGDCPQEQKRKEMFSEEVNLIGKNHMVFTYWELDAIGGYAGRLANEVRRGVNEKLALIKQLNNYSTCQLLKTSQHRDTKMKDLVSQQMEESFAKFKQEVGLIQIKANNDESERLTALETRMNELFNLQKKILDKIQ